MPLIAVNLSQKTYSEVMALVASGAYTGPEQFLEIAAFNQLALERGLTPDELLKGIHRPAAREASLSSKTPGPNNALAVKLSERDDSRASARTQSRTSLTKRSSVAEVTEEELKSSLARLSRGKCAGMALALCVSDASNGNQRIWGQVNRLFPLKAACRWIAVAAVEKRSWPDLHSLTETLVSDAATIGSALEKCDTKAGRTREGMVSTGLPRKGNLQSGDRFLSQFIARVTRANQVHPGAICQYRLACFVGEELQLTESGLALSGLPNPVLDENFGDSARTLSDQERKFFLDLIWSSIPAEKQDFSVVLNSILKGNTKPDSLLAASRSEFPNSWSDLEFRTHIYGILARSAELGLLTRQREGRNVQYRVSEASAAMISA
jgi:hypothetical protein